MPCRRIQTPELIGAFTAETNGKKPMSPCPALRASVAAALLFPVAVEVAILGTASPMGLLQVLRTRTHEEGWGWGP